MRYDGSFKEQAFFDHYLSENRPVLIKDYCWEWPATREWSDLSKFKEKNKD